MNKDPRTVLSSYSPRIIDSQGENSEILRNVLTHVPHFIFWKDINSVFLGCNHALAEIAGLGDPSEIIGKTDFDMPWSADEAEFYVRCDKEVMESGKPLLNVEEKQTQADGKEAVLLTSKVPLRDSSGRVVGLLGIFADITEQKRIEKELVDAKNELEIRVAQRTKELEETVAKLKQEVTERKRAEERLLQTQKLESLGVLAGGIAHDFNNILMGVIGNASVAMRKLPVSSPAFHNIQSIELAGQRAADLTKQLLAFSGKGTFLIEAVDISRTLRDMSNLLKLSVSKKAELEFRLAEDLPLVMADVSQLRQIFVAFVTNASEALAEEAGRIVVSTGSCSCDRRYLEGSYVQEELSEGEFVYLEVEDTGCGMEKEMLKRIFDPFYSTKFTGRGLGLAAVLGIIRSHKAGLVVKSELGEGTTFRVLFPVAKSTRSLEHVAHSGEQPGSQTGGAVLVIDDEEIVRMLCREILEARGFAVIEAADGLEGEKVFKERASEVSLVVLDLTMPGLSGEELFARIRAVNKEMPVLITSGYSELEALSRFEQLNVSGFLQKPYREDELIDSVRELLDASIAG